MGAIEDSDVSAVDSLPHAATKAMGPIIPTSTRIRQFSNPLTGIATDPGPELVCSPGAAAGAAQPPVAPTISFLSMWRRGDAAV